MLSYFFRVGRVEYLTLTHLDIAYLDQPIKVCIDYQLKGKSVPYRPDQTYLNKIKPIYLDLPSWNGIATRQASSFDSLPENSQKYLCFITKSLNTKLFMATTGPKRDQTIKFY
jgi:adenylosuccinate synthase